MTANEFGHKVFLYDHPERLGAVGVHGSWTISDETGKPRFDATLQLGDCFRTISLPFVVYGGTETLAALAQLNKVKNAVQLLINELGKFELARTDTPDED